MANMEYMRTIGTKRGHAPWWMFDLGTTASSRAINLKIMHIDTWKGGTSGYRGGFGVAMVVVVLLDLLLVWLIISDHMARLRTWWKRELVGGQCTGELVGIKYTPRIQSLPQALVRCWGASFLWLSWPSWWLATWRLSNWITWAGYKQARPLAMG